ncbi:TonB-dependent receptor [Rheinheimera aquimaris]|jgi:TonB-dependent receptor|uniref:TonB-dependent receptor n=1 Tax=Rheinheimera aquimaris TaxID=412437 RepID=UPI0010651D7C|nr:TonB-dependent receptor [Rheinheimera aquimaris]|tara:strand:- start:1489 stop:4440 length:2952 start_codon:yes stop_codon:yes gene_type:complete
MKNVTFTKSRLATAIAVLMASSLVQAQDTNIADSSASEEIEVIQISGIRGSLIRSMDVKRDASGVVDAISAEEMGKFPDTNLAESLQRITGVSVSRSNGEGSQITVRGFGPEFNLITLNGRQMPGTGNTRSYNLENLASDGISAIEVYKTARAENPSGGLGATVNIITAKPLKSPGLRYSVSAKGIYDSSNEEGDDITPELSAIFSNTFADEKFGVAISVSHQQRDFQRQYANIQGWQAQTSLPVLDAANVIDARPEDAEGNKIGPAYFAKDMNYGIDDVERERSNGQVTLQFAPVDNFVATLDYTASQATTGVNTIGWGIWNEFGGNINAYELDENGTAVYADISGNDGSFTASRNTTEVTARSVGLNLDWQVTEDFHLSLDYHDSDNKTDNGADKGLGSDGQVIIGSDQLVTKIYDYRTGDIPQASILWRNGTNELTPGEMDSNFSQFTHSPGKSDIKQLQLDSTWYNSVFDIPLASIKAGVAFTDQTMGGHNAWSGLRGGAGFSPSFTEIFPDSMFTRHSTAGFLDEFSGGGLNMASPYYYTYSFDEAVARQAAYLTEGLMGADAYVADAYYDGIDSESSVQEETLSVYLQSDWQFDIGRFPARFNASVRYEETDVTSTVRQTVPQQVVWASASEWITQYLQGEDTFLTLTGKHDVLLPMFDFRIDLTDDIVARVSWGKTIARAPLGNLAGGRSLSGSPKIGSRTGSEGNTNLQPFESTNLDLSLEYYYAEGSYASVGYFKKDVKNFIANETVEAQFDGLHDIYLGPRYLEAEQQLIAAGDANPDTSAIYQQMLDNGHGNANGVIEPTANDPLITWLVTRPYNSNDKSVDGFEVAVQHLFGETGFGVGANATFVDGDVKFDVTSLEVQSPLNGLGDSANFQAFYENHGLSVKVTYAWRDSYLIGVGQSQGSADAPPQFAKTFGQWDMSINYDINDNLTVFFEGINLNNETEQGYGRYEEQFLFARQYGTRYALGVRYSFQ